jgi:hypothetical protein
MKVGGYGVGTARATGDTTAEDPHGWFGKKSHIYEYR